MPIVDDYSGMDKLTRMRKGIRVEVDPLPPEPQPDPDPEPFRENWDEDEYDDPTQNPTVQEQIELQEQFQALADREKEGQQLVDTEALIQQAEDLGRQFCNGEISENFALSGLRYLGVESPTQYLNCDRYLPDSTLTDPLESVDRGNYEFSPPNDGILPDTVYQSVNSWKDLASFCEVESLQSPFAPLADGSFWSIPTPSNYTKSLILSTLPQSGGEVNSLGFRLVLSPDTRLELTINLTTDIEEFDPYSDTFTITLYGGDSIDANVNQTNGIQKFDIIKNGTSFIDPSVIDIINQQYMLNGGEVEIKLTLDKFEYPNIPESEEYQEEEEEDEPFWTQNDSWIVLGLLIMGIGGLFIISQIRRVKSE
tara:strand:- start:366 stop:1466 length:1101 start_codon:yes stop_codon:yes gene_type:complete